MPVKVTWNDKEIQNPFLRVTAGFFLALYAVLAASIAVIGAVLTVVWVCFLVLVCIITSPVWLLVDAGLKHYNRIGFVRSVRGGLNVTFDEDSFRKIN